MGVTHIPAILSHGDTSPDHVGVSYQWLATILVDTPVASMLFSSIPQTYATLLVYVFPARADSAGKNWETCFMQFNGDTGSNYNRQDTYVTGTTYLAAASAGSPACWIGYCTAATTPANIGAAIQVWIPSYANTSWQKAIIGSSVANLDNSSGALDSHRFSGLWRSTAAVTDVELHPASPANWVVGTQAVLYGLDVS